ncbi:hypothetical protein [Hymenobacter weizhouensis]|uniref:hypothetical protein n=1 Tax=Hymenobacter sp. YIM 151500-1 TaxID=2987689 RepID=UPI002226BA5D|nr:hypothetical protein [Hymenobacter sp. YIM 151500-1]UYZ64930.1 hypothetical protein OIS53_08775 [Hymenobacter sp. YIM 151500-1]
MCRPILHAHRPDPLVQPQLTVQQPPRDDTEAAELAKLAELVATTAPLFDLRNLAPAVRRLFPEPAYLVGCGGAHIWLHRTTDPHRLAIICEFNPPERAQDPKPPSP